MNHIDYNCAYDLCLGPEMSLDISIFQAVGYTMKNGYANMNKSKYALKIVSELVEIRKRIGEMKK